MASYFPSYRSMMRQHGRHLVLEAVRIEHAEGLKEVISWLEILGREYTKPSVRAFIGHYEKTLTAYTSDAKKYAHLTKDKVRSLLTPEFLSQRKCAIERSAVQRTLDFYLTVDPTEYDYPLPLNILQKIRKTQMQTQWDIREQFVRARVGMEVTKEIETKDVLLRRRLFGSNWWMA